MEALEQLCAERLEQFNTAGQAPGIHPLSLAEMARRYRSGALDPARKAAAAAA
jgi:fructose-bisphosphate aldolase class II